MRSIERWIESGVVPDAVTRWGIRRLLAARLDDEGRDNPPRRQMRAAELRRRLRDSPIAVEVERANRQHYELPPEFFRLLLGPRMKYSCAHWPAAVDDLASAEEAMLALSAERAGLTDGQRVLDLGCGWGSLALWTAERYPHSRVVAVSNSSAQGDYIRAEAERRGISRVEVVTADVNRFEPQARFDRIVSIEMLEHVRNWGALSRRLSSWLEPEGRLFVHVFCHRTIGYVYEPDGRRDWMARHFFSGGTMPSADLLPDLAEGLAIERSWIVGGEHYRRTLEAWLARLDARRPAAARLLGSALAVRRWRIFLMACSELFGYRDGTEWSVAHYRFRPAGRPD